MQTYVGVKAESDALGRHSNEQKDNIKRYRMRAGFFSDQGP
jgi:hypothetical protein